MNEIKNVGPIEDGKKTSPIIHHGGDLASNSCHYNGQEYSNGSLICMLGTVYVCAYGTWISKHESCA